MKKLLKLAAITCGVLVAGNVYAAKTAAVSITQISQGSSGNIFVEHTGTMLNPNSCPQTRYVIEPGDANKNTYMAILLTAKASANQVRLNVADTSCVNDNKNPKITNIELQ